LIAKILDKVIEEQDNSRSQSACARRPTVWTETGAYNLPTTYDRILVTRSLSTSCDHMPDEVPVGERNVANRYKNSFLRCVIWI